MVRPERFELPTCCSGGNRSIQLSYGRGPSFRIIRELFYLRLRVQMGLQINFKIGV